MITFSQFLAGETDDKPIEIPIDDIPKDVEESEE